MTDETPDEGPRPTSLEDLPGPVARALVAGYNPRVHWGEPKVDPPTDPELAEAFAWGDRLGQAADLVFSASTSEFRGDCARYDQVARELNERYGAGLAQLMDEGHPSLRGRPRED